MVRIQNNLVEIVNWWPTKIAKTNLICQKTSSPGAWTVSILYLWEKFKIFLWSQLSELKLVWQKWSLGDPLQKLLKNLIRQKTWLSGAVANAPISPRIILVLRVPDQYFWLIGRISAKQSGTRGQSPTITWEGLERRNRLSPTRVGYRKSDRLLFLNMFKNSSRSKAVGCWSSWSSEGPLKVALSRLPSGAFVYLLELSSTPGSFRIPSAALCRGSCEECHKESIVTKSPR